MDPQPHTLQTAANKLGVFRRYTHILSWNPKNDERLDLICNLPSVDTPPPTVNENTIHELSLPKTAPLPTSVLPHTWMATYFSGMDIKSKAHVTSLTKAAQHSMFQ